MLLEGWKARSQMDWLASQQDDFVVARFLHLGLKDRVVVTLAMKGCGMASFCFDSKVYSETLPHGRP